MDEIGTIVISAISFVGIAFFVKEYQKQRIQQLRKQWAFKKGTILGYPIEWFLDETPVQNNQTTACQSSLMERSAKS